MRVVVVQADNRNVVSYPTAKELNFDIKSAALDRFNELNDGKLTNEYNYWSLSRLINQSKSKALGWEYHFVHATSEEKCNDRHICWVKINVMLDMFQKYEENDILVFLDSDAWIHDHLALQKMIDYFSSLPEKHGMISRDLKHGGTSFVCTGVFIVKNTPYIRDLFKRVWNDVVMYEPFRWFWPYEQGVLSEYIHREIDNFVICKVTTMNTPGGTIIRHAWIKEVAMQLMMDGILSCLQMHDCSPLPEFDPLSHLDEETYPLLGYEKRVRLPTSHADVVYKLKLDLMKPILDHLENLIIQSGEPCEGNCFMYHATTTYAPELLPRQINLFACGINAKNVLEIGFNAGHSALIFLMANSLSKLTIFDNCVHKYTRPCYQYLASIFPGRLNLIEGDSVSTLPEYIKTHCNHTFDVVHLDASRELVNALSDIENTRMMSTPYTLVIISECHQDAIKKIVAEYESANEFVRVEGQLETYLYSHVIVRWMMAHVGDRNIKDNMIEHLKDVIVTHHLRQLSKRRCIPEEHIHYLQKLKNSGFEPKVIYDIGACVLHWTNEAKRLWPNAEYILFDAFAPAEFLYIEGGYKYHVGALSDSDGKTVRFYQNDIYPGGNSYYREIGYMNGNLFPENNYILKTTRSLDSIVAERNLPLPDLIKMDVQGAELDIIRGAACTTKHAMHMILELQHTDYNLGAPKAHECVPIIEDLGWKCVAPLFSNNGSDGDYHFMRKNAM